MNFSFDSVSGYYVHSVSESWKTTGCTLMIFNLQNHENKGRILSGLEKDMYVIALYCPKGILFVDAQDPDGGYTDALKRQSPSLHIDDRVHWLYHSAYVVASVAVIVFLNNL